MYSFAEGSRRQRRGPKGLFRSLASWWRRRSFHAVHDDVPYGSTYNDINLLEDESDIEDDMSEFLDTTGRHLVPTANHPIRRSPKLAFEKEQALVSPISARTSRARSKTTPAPLPQASAPPVHATTPNSPNFSMQIVKKNQDATFIRNHTIDSFQGSLESLDSLTESHWDPEDDSRQATNLMRNIANHPSEFFQEHVRFLKGKTHPRDVQLVIDTTTTNNTQDL